MNVVTLLEDLGHVPAEAGSATEALRAFEQGEFDLLITDHAMPKMTGAELIAELRVSRPNLPIILASGYADIPGGAPPGIVRLSKPFDQRQLEEAIQVAMQTSKAGLELTS